MRTILIPQQQDLHDRYHSDGTNVPVIINQRFLNWVNDHPDMIAVAIPYDDKYIDYISETNDDIGVLLAGGCDIGEIPERDKFELGVIEACSNANVPLFGICRGMEMINYYHGGTFRLCDNHWQPNFVTSDTHEVIFVPNTLFSSAFGTDMISVNTFHRWCVDLPGDKVEICGNSEDGIGAVPECIAVKGKPMAGVQWHPSFMRDNWTSSVLLDLFYELPNKMA